MRVLQKQFVQFMRPQKIQLDHLEIRFRVSSRRDLSQQHKLILKLISY